VSKPNRNPASDATSDQPNRRGVMGTPGRAGRERL
jgi:hypothetical protein